MAILLTNGKYYIAHNRTGAVIKVADIEQAQDFYSVERAINQRNRTPGKCAGYYYIDTEKYKAKIKRKNYSNEERKIIYNKSGGRCELCGRKILLEDMTIDHITPLAMGGEDDVENLSCTCYPCNLFKGNILPSDFMERITDIFLYQMEKQHKDRVKWKIVHKMLNKMI